MFSRYKHFWANDHKFITYDRLITDYSNGEYLNSFDVEAGTFTAGTAGGSYISYIINISVISHLYELLTFCKQDCILLTSVAQFLTTPSMTTLRYFNIIIISIIITFSIFVI